MDGSIIYIGSGMTCKLNFFRSVEARIRPVILFESLIEVSIIKKVLNFFLVRIILT